MVQLQHYKVLEFICLLEDYYNVGTIESSNPGGSV
jgi:hypothetical protein